jgi:hypothetical protein
VTRLVAGQRAIVLQLPVGPKTELPAVARGGQAMDHDRIAGTSAAIA